MTRRFWVGLAAHRPLLAMAMSDMLPGMPVEHALPAGWLPWIELASGHSGRPLGRMAILPARLGVAGEPLDQHVHPDRHGHRSRLPLQFDRDFVPGNFPRIIPRDGWHAAGLFRSFSRHCHPGASGAGSRTSCPQPYWRCHPRPARSFPQDRAHFARGWRSRYSTGPGETGRPAASASRREGSGGRRCA